jgi:hypothetical protein
MIQKQHIIFLSLLLLVGGGCTEIDKATQELESIQEQAMVNIIEEEIVEVTEEVDTEKPEEETPLTVVIPDTPPEVQPEPTPTPTPSPTPNPEPTPVVPEPKPVASTCTDSDGDGFFAEGGSCGPQDCKDKYRTVYPGAREVCANGLDDNCNGAVDEEGCVSRTICLGEGCSSDILFNE